MKTKDGTKTKRKFISLAEVRPDLAKEWNYEKNGDLRPEDMSYGSKKKVWWILHYEVPDDYPIESLRGKHFDFEWEAQIKNRSKGVANCPFLSGRAVWPGFNDLQTINPKLAAQWHPTKNGDLKPTQITIATHKKIWWLFSYDVPMDYKVEKLRGKHFDFEWQVRPNKRLNDDSCPFLTNQAVWKGFNDLATINPNLANEWDYKLNDGLTPQDVTANSHKKVWWHLPYNIPDNYTVKSLRGKHIDFQWLADIAGRNHGNGCPFLSGHAVWEGFNDLQTVNPELAKQWHPIKNGNLKPNQITANSGFRVWWLFSYDDQNTGRHFDFEWQAAVNDRESAVCCQGLSRFKGEEYIKQYLQAHDISFSAQKKLPGLSGLNNGLLSYDFSILNKTHEIILIEYNGIQHYAEIPYYGGKTFLEKQQEHDRRKREYAKQHGYKLITIKYTYDTYEKVAEYLDKHLPKENCKKVSKKAA